MYELSLKTGIPEDVLNKIEDGMVEPSYSDAKKIFDVIEGSEEKKREAPENPAKAKDIMQTELVTVKPTDTMAKAIEVMKKKGIAQIPVMKGNEDIGCVSEKVVYDILFRGYDDMSELLEEEVGDVMNRPLPKIDENEPIEKVKDVLEKVNAVLVTRKGRVVGIITRADIARLNL